MKSTLKRISKADVAFYLENGFLPMAGGAVINDYVGSTALQAEKKGQGLDQVAGNLFIGVVTFEVAAADSDASIYRLFKDVNSSLIPVSMRVSCDAITGCSDVDFGLYDSLDAGGAVVDKDCLGDGLDISAGYSRILGLDCLVNVDLSEARKRLWELVDAVTLTLNTKKGAYDIAMTANTVGSGAGTVTVVAIFAQG